MPTPRTSQTHPLQIASLPADNGALGLTLCPGKHQPDAASGVWLRDLDTDLDAIEAWGASAIVTLLEPHELDALEVPHLGDSVERRRIDWFPIPIPDGGTPNDVGEARWLYSAARLRAHLAAGRRVLVHCKGGLGRTGMIAARLLVELGVAADDAAARVRQVRPGAIETDAQLAWARGGRVVDDEALVRADRMLGCLVGGAVGDAFGYAIEFDSLDTILRERGPRGLVDPLYDADGRLVVSDDTQMTLFTCEALLRADAVWRLRGSCSVPEIAWHAYRRWARTQGVGSASDVSQDGWLMHEPALCARRAPGNTCLSALLRDDPPPGFRAANDSKGCGGVMRVAPVGLMGADAHAAATLFDTACDFAGLTHGHPTGWLGSGAMAAIVNEALWGATLREGAGVALRLLGRHGDGARETTAAVEAALRAADSRDGVEPMDAVQALGEGWIAEEALAIGLYAALVGESFPSVIRIAANHGGDSDSTASVAGQLYGAAHGLADLPQAWARRLDVLDPLLVLAHDLWAVTAGQGGRVVRAYPPN